jgi:hypothetical protein
MGRPHYFFWMLVGAASLAVSLGAASAASPTPTPVATAAATSTPPPDQISTFRGSCWLNAQLCAGPMTAKVGDNVCATDSNPIAPASALNRLLFTLRVPSDQVVPGCGSEGAQVTFWVGDQQTIETAVWHAGALQAMFFVAGIPFARFDGSLAKQQAPGLELTPFIGATRCGFGYWGPGGYEADVLSASQQPGCGTEGGQVTFKVLDAQGNVIAVANETGTWHAWDGINEPPPLNLTFPTPARGPSIPNVGTGDASESSSGSADLRVVLGSVGVAAIACGLALRRRALRG